MLTEFLIENIGRDNIMERIDDEEFKKIDLNNPKHRIIYILVNVLLWPVIVMGVLKEIKDMDDFTKLK
jgi:hypothetical protein